MTEQKAPEKGEHSGLTREEQNRRIIPAMRKLLPPVMQAATMFHQHYPLDRTPAAVVDAVTVPVPLRHFMLMVSLVANLCIMEEERAKASVAFPQDHLPEGAA
jgi:hypothetical protein